MMAIADPLPNTGSTPENLDRIPFDQLSRAGTLLYGLDWPERLRQDLNLAPQQVAEWVEGRAEPCHSGLKRSVAWLLLARGAEVSKLIDEL
ncbi:hypothetical protein ACEUZ9_002762 [Paracoccus litorisediminis]|uniref:hypothetical protein n=1 Tax=Paracoccus litorisediminis TaxID=2006130 RepID=UPI0037308CBB